MATVRGYFINESRKVLKETTEPARKRRWCPPSSRLVVLPGVGHYPHVEAADAVIQTVDDFIATTTPWQRVQCTKVPVATDCCDVK